MKPELIEEKPINSAMLKSMLEKIKEDNGELNFRAEKTIDYLNQSVSISSKEAEEIYTKIEELSIPRLKDIHIHKVIDIMPKHLEEVKNIFQGYTISISDENLNKILDIIKGYI